MFARREAKRLIIAAALAAIVATPAAALSCMAPSFDRAFDRARDAEAIYSIFVGSIDVNEEKVKRLSKDGRTSFETVARFSGKSLFVDGLTPPFERDVTVRVNCMGDWCGTASDMDGVLFFGEMKPSGSVELQTSACGGTFFDADEAMIHQAFERLHGLQ